MANNQSVRPSNVHHVEARQGRFATFRCEYCYYLEKQQLYTHCPTHIISDQMLEKFIREYIEAQTTPEVLFTWHGGETLMRPISFYKRALQLQHAYARGRQVDNCIQPTARCLMMSGANSLRRTTS